MQATPRHDAASGYEPGQITVHPRPRREYNNQEGKWQRELARVGAKGDSQIDIKTGPPSGLPPRYLAPRPGQAMEPKKSQGIPSPRTPSPRKQPKKSQGKPPPGTPSPRTQPKKSQGKPSRGKPSPSKTSEPQPEPTAEEGEMEHGVSEFAALSMGEVSDALIDGRPDRVIEWLKNNNIDAKGQTPYLIKHLLYILEGEEPRPYPINILDKRGTMFKTIFLAFRLEAISVKNIMRILAEADIQFPKEDHESIKALAAGVPRRSSVSDADRYKVALVQILLSNPRGRAQLFKEEMQPDRDKLPRSKSAYINKTITHLGEANEEAEKPPSDWDMDAFKKLVERKARHRSGTSGTAKKFAVINGILADDNLKNYVDEHWADIAPYLKD